MHKDVTAARLGGDGVSVRLNELPDLCPRCHKNIQPNFLNSYVLGDLGVCQAIFRCTSQKCQEIFIANYSHISTTQPQLCTLQNLTPFAPKKIHTPEIVAAISPTFVEIYNQTNAAQTAGLDQIVGIGLRKALEFLIKDFATLEHPESEEQIRRGLLAACINTYIVDTNVKECAKRAAWLGNDETHYTRKWETKDINDLKLLVRLTINWIENSLLTKKYISEMS